MPNDINELDVNDVGLKQIFGDRFHDETEPAAEKPKQEQPRTVPVVKAVKNPMDIPVEEQWQPVKVRNYLDNLRDCAKVCVTFGGLNLLIFYWQQAGLMASSIAVPSMCACACLMGLGIGKVVGKK